MPFSDGLWIKPEFIYWSVKRLNEWFFQIQIDQWGWSKIAFYRKLYKNVHKIVLLPGQPIRILYFSGKIYWSHQSGGGLLRVIDGSPLKALVSLHWAQPSFLHHHIYNLGLLPTWFVSFSCCPLTSMVMNSEVDSNRVFLLNSGPGIDICLS